MLNVIIGLIMIILVNEFVESLLLIVGLMILFKAVTWLQTSLELKEVDNKPLHIETLYSIILMILGIIFLVFPFASSVSATIYHGIAIIIESGIEIFSILRFAYLHKEEREEIENQ